LIVIGIPRALMFYRFSPIWINFFSSLGVKVIVSGEEGKRILKEDSYTIPAEESCFPFKLAIIHAQTLVDKTDMIFLPRLIAIEKKGIMCPKFRGVPDIVRVITKHKTPIISETYDIGKGKKEEERFYLKIGMRLGFSSRLVKDAYLFAKEEFKKFEKGFINRLNAYSTSELFNYPYKIQMKDKKNYEFKVGVIGHPYNLYDIDISKGVLDIIKGMGIKVIPGDKLDINNFDKKFKALHKEIYWSTGWEIVRGALYFLEESDMDGVIFITSFKCGVDAIVMEFIKHQFKKLKGKIPLLVLSFDEHTSRDGVITRLEAFYELITTKKKNSLNYN